MAFKEFYGAESQSMVYSRMGKAPKRYGTLSEADDKDRVTACNHR
jgi:hypothetical protein